MRDYEVCVIGSGPSGFAAAMRAWDLGKRVCLVDRGPLGGAGLHDGALSSKTLWELSRDYRKAMRTDRGFVASDVQVSWSEVTRVVDEAVGEKRRQLERQVDALAESCEIRGRCLTLIRGHAKFVDPHTIEIRASGRALRRITSDAYIVATGSTPRELPDVPVDGKRILTSNHISRLQDFPKSMVILGAGVVGCEFATIFANFGQTEVFVIDRAPRILPFVDDDIAAVCAANLRGLGVTIHQGARLAKMAVQDEKVVYDLEYADGHCERREVSHALISIGRIPCVADLGLEEIGIEFNERGRIKVDDTRTSLPHIHAVGDVSDDIALVNVGEIEGRHAAEQLCGLTPDVLSYDSLSTIMFLDPEVASIGLDEARARAKQLPYRVVSYRFSLLNRAVAMRATGGFVKLLVADDASGKILGMQALGIHASTMLEAVSLLIHQGLPATILTELLHPHPAVTEALQECARMLQGTSIFKAHVFPTELRTAVVRYDESGAPIEIPLSSLL